MKTQLAKTAFDFKQDIAYEALVHTDQMPEFEADGTKAFVHEITKNVKIPECLDEGPARIHARTTVEYLRLGFQPATWDEKKLGPKPMPVVRQPLTSESTVYGLVVARVSGPAQDTPKWRADVYEQAERTIPKILAELGLYKDGHPPEVFWGIRVAVDSANAGFRNQRHTLWGDAFEKDFPRVDVVLVLGQSGFASDLPTWLYAATCLAPTAKVFSRYETTSMWCKSPAEIKQFVTRPLADMREHPRRMDDPFISQARTELNRQLRSAGHH